MLMLLCVHVTRVSTGGKFRPDYGLLLELHALTLVVRSYALLRRVSTLQELDELGDKAVQEMYVSDLHTVLLVEPSIWYESESPRFVMQNTGERERKVNNMRHGRAWQSVHELW